jgi:hypothetical protein
MKPYLFLKVFCLSIVGGQKLVNFEQVLVGKSSELLLSVVCCFATLRLVYFDLQKIARKEAYSQTRVYKLYQEFSEGTRLSSENDQYEGKERTATDDIHK